MESVSRHERADRRRGLSHRRRAGSVAARRSAPHRACCVPRQVLTEADRNISSKLPEVLSEYRALLRQLAPHVVEDPNLRAVQETARVIHPKDAPVLAAARLADVDYLVTWNTRHFQTDPVRACVRFPPMTPGEFLRAFRRMLPTDL